MNNGNSLAENVVLTDQLPQDFLINKIELLSNKETTELEKNSYSVNGNNITIFNQNFSLDIKAKEKIEINIYGMIKKS